MKRILFLVNHEVVIYNFRLEIVERMISDGHEVHISSPYGERIKNLIFLGAKYHEINMDRHGMNPREEIRILCHYKKLIKDVKPDIVLGFTIKPNIYGSIVSGKYGVPFVANITGLGTAVENGGIKQKIIVLMYRYAFGTKHGKLQRVFFQNKENEMFFKDNCIALDKHALLPGSGVNTERFSVVPFPECGDGKTGEKVKLAFISRIMSEKGIEQYLTAAERVREEYPATEFHVCGFFEPEYDKTHIDELVAKGTIIYDGNIDDVAGFMGKMHCIVHPTYYPEGLSNVLLEASSCGRPIITTNRAGCREVCHDGVNGYLVAERNTGELIDAIKRFVQLNNRKKESMGKAGRKLIEEQYDRQFIVKAYMDELYRTETDRVE